jgi:Zn-dependent peptidase ImmA (M78 family)/DNA-binding XRE family transcriptional regulator
VTVVPTKGAVLEWARKFRGLTEEEASERLGIAVTDLLAYESDDKHPSVTLFEAMASKYRLPQATLFLETAPAVPAEPTDFRTIGGHKKRDHSFEFKVALSNVRTLLFHLEKAAQDDIDFLPPELPHPTMSGDAAALGERERRRLNISVDEQLGWEPREAFGRWRAHVEKQGVLVFQQKFPMDDGRGFSLYDTETAPAIIVNKEETTDTAKAFTVWHEYCHLLLRRPGVSDHRTGNPVEAYCNRFAAAFLIPTEALRRLLPRWPNEPVEWSATDIASWAKRLKVSRRALAIRLEELNLAPDGYSDRFAWGGAAPQRLTPGGSYIATRLSELGGSFTARMLDAYDRRAIDGVQFAEAVGLGTDRINDVRQYVARSRERAGAA